jgi:hypothetical protein
MVGENCEGDKTWQAWPVPGTEEVPFGQSGGWLEAGTNHARSPLLDGNKSAVAASGPGDPNCTTGIPDQNSKGDVCCLKSCGKCGCPKGVPNHCEAGVTKKKDGCCLEEILAEKRPCTSFPPPCMLGPAPPPAPPGTEGECLFNLATDKNETTNLRNVPGHDSLFAALKQRLEEAGATGPPLASAFPPDVGPINKTVTALICAQQEKYGFLEPMDWRSGPTGGGR